MKILSLRIQNINSLKGDNFIDFNAYPLKNTGLFAITGPTGAGKSTILDAITLALYNYVPRNGKLSKSSIAKYGAIITRGTKSCYAEIEYQVAEGVFRSKWSIGLTRNGSLRDYDMEISKRDINGDYNILDFKKGIVPGENTRLIGLSEDQFVKSILLSQGEFARFLKAKSKERSELLESITGTEIYRQIGLSAFAKNKEEKDKLDIINSRLEGVDLLTDDELEEKKISEQQIVTDLKMITRKEEELEKALNIKKDILIQTKEKEKLQLQQELISLDFKNKEKDFVNLHKHESLLHIKGDLLLTRDLETGICESKIKDTKLKEEITILNERLLIADKEYGFSNEKLYVSLAEKKSSLALFKQVRACDEDIKLCDENLAKKKEIIDNSNARKQKLSELRNKNIISISELDVDVAKQKKWVKDNSLLEKAENDVLRIREKLNEMNSKFESLKKDLNVSDYKELSSFVGKNTIQNSLLFIKEKIKSYEKEINIIYEDIKLYGSKSKHEIISKQDLVREDIIHISILKDIQERYFIAGNKEKAYSKEIEILSISKQNIQIELKANRDSFSILKLYIDELKIKNTRLALESNMGIYRDNLEKGNACPLCGSCEHPFVNNYHSNIDDTAKHLEEKEKEFDLLRDKIHRLEIKAMSIQTRTDENYKQKESLSIEMANDEDLFMKNTLSVKYKLYVSDKLCLNNTEQKIKSIDTNLKIQYLLYEKLESRKNSLEYFNNVSDKINDINILYTSALDSIAVYSVLLPEAKLSEQITKLSALYDTYCSAKENIDSLAKDLIKLSVSNEGIIVQLSELEVNIESDAKLILAQKDVLSALKDKRSSIFADKNVDDQQEKLDLMHDMIIKKNHKAKELLDGIKAKLDFLNISLKSLRTECNKDEIKCLDIKSVLLAKLEILGYEDIYTALNCLLNDNIYEELKLCFEKLNSENSKNINLIESIERKIVELNAKDDSSVLLLSLEKELESEKEKGSILNQRLGSISECLRKHKENLSLQRTVVIQRDLQIKECSRWDRLNELIGDAKGDKYSKFAQELTLQQMLSLANKHLLKLNKRYLLKYDSKRNDDLLIVDLLQANDERSVRTLSGGESFLISLALALGLSDLAGQNTQIESLFIDEGFGTLDQETLDSALSTLETLQAESNRTIGIISHVKALKERISTQIELDKDPQGYSTIRII